MEEDQIGEILPHHGSERMGTKIIGRDAKVINLEDGKIAGLLPESPQFYHLEELFLNRSDVMKLSSSFFEHMPVLKVLDMSHTSIKTLPSSISKLCSLEKLILKCCVLLMELPPEIGELGLLKVLDLDGTEVMYLPEEIGNLTSLEELTLSIYGYGERVRKEKGIRRIYPRGAFSKLLNLKILSIDVNPEEEQWIYEVESVISDLKMINFRSLQLYLPKVELLGLLTSPNFHFIVGQYEQRLISRIPLEAEEKFKTRNKSIRYINGESISTQLVSALRCARAFFLDRHWSIRKLSEMGSANLANLGFALLVECNELETILDEDESQFDGRLRVLEYLGLYYLKSLTSICRGPVGMGTLCTLKHLILRTCTSLTQVFTFELLKNLEILEELVIEDCPNIKSLVTEVSSSTDLGFLPSLKRMSLLWLPELVSITNNICIAPALEGLVVFHCRKLKSISTKELSLQHLNVLKGEKEWWDSLGWNHGGLASIFVEIRMDEKLNFQLREDDSSLPGDSGTSSSVGTVEEDIFNDQVNSLEIGDDFEFGDEEILDIKDNEVNQQKLRRRISQCKIELWNPCREGKKLLVLDIDYMLLNNQSTEKHLLHLMSPYLHEFLTAVYAEYDIIIWSAASMKWVEFKIRPIGFFNNPNFKITALLDNLAMITVESDTRGNFDCKPLGLIWAQFPEFYNSKNTIMLADLTRIFVMNPKNGLRMRPVKKVHANQVIDIVKLTQYLLFIAEFEDINAHDHRYWESFHEMEVIYLRQIDRLE